MVNVWAGISSNSSVPPFSSLNISTYEARRSSLGDLAPLRRMASQISVALKPNRPSPQTTWERNKDVDI